MYKQLTSLGIVLGMLMATIPAFGAPVDPDGDGVSNDVPFWHTYVVDASVGTPGKNPASLQVHDGQPAVAYQDSTSGELRYAYRTATGWQNETVDGGGAAGSVGDYAHLQFHNGYPTIAYQNATGADTMFAYKDSSGWHTRAVSSSGGIYTAYVLIGDTAWISSGGMQGPGNGSLYVAHRHADNWGESTPWNQTYVYGTSVAAAAEEKSMTSVGGQPAIAWYNNNGKHLQYSGFNGTLWNTSFVEEVPAATSGPCACGSGQWSSITTLNGDPIISYWKRAAGALGFAYLNGTTWQNESADATAGAGLYTSIAVVGGEPAITHYNSNLKALMYTTNTTSGWHTETVDSGGAGDVGAATSLAVLGGKPVIAYYNVTGGHLQYAYKGTDNCPNVANVNQTDTDGDGVGDECDPTPNGGSTSSSTATSSASPKKSSKTSQYSTCRKTYSSNYHGEETSNSRCRFPFSFNLSFADDDWFTVAVKRMRDATPPSALPDGFTGLDFMFTLDVDPKPTTGKFSVRLDNDLFTGDGTPSLLVMHNGSWSEVPIQTIDNGDGTVTASIDMRELEFGTFLVTLKAPAPESTVTATATQEQTPEGEAPLPAQPVPWTGGVVPLAILIGACLAVRRRL